MVFMIMMAYSTIAPLLPPFGVLFFMFAYVMYKYQIGGYEVCSFANPTLPYPPLPVASSLCSLPPSPCSGTCYCRLMTNPWAFLVSFTLARCHCLFLVLLRWQVRAWNLHFGTPKQSTMRLILQQRMVDRARRLVHLSQDDETIEELEAYFKERVVPLSIVPQGHIFGSE